MPVIMNLKPTTTFLYGVEVHIRIIMKLYYVYHNQLHCVEVHMTNSEHLLHTYYY